MNIKLNKVTIDDIETLKNISIETFTDTFKDDNKKEDLDEYIKRAYNSNVLKQEIENKNSFFYFLKSEDEIVGYLKVNINDAQSEKMGEDKLEVERIYILPSSKRKGYGKVLMGKAIELAKDFDKKSIWLGVWEKNFKAIAFYESLGFKKTSSHVFYMGDDEQIDYIYMKNL